MYNSEGGEVIPFILARVATSATRVATNATAHTHLIAFPASAATFQNYLLARTIGVDRPTSDVR